MNSQTIKEKLRALGADLCGIATVDRFDQAPAGFHPRDVLPDCKSVIVFAKRFPVGTLTCRTTVPYTIARNMLTQQLDLLSVAFAAWLEEQGAICVPTGAISHNPLDPQTGRWRSLISAKHSAVLAGLGRLGRNGLVVTPEFGNMVWLAAMPCNLDLEPDRLMTSNPCPPGCTRCVDQCPAQALDGAELDQQACHEQMFHTEPGGDLEIRCHLCRSQCPNNLGMQNKIKMQR